MKTANTTIFGQIVADADAAEADVIAELADLLAWMNDADGNTPENYPGPGWDDPGDRGAWSPDDVVTLAATA